LLLLQVYKGTLIAAGGFTAATGAEAISSGESNNHSPLPSVCVA
jgi:hypothetical protein